MLCVRRVADVEHERARANDGLGTRVRRSLVLRCVRRTCSRFSSIHPSSFSDGFHGTRTHPRSFRHRLHDPSATFPRLVVGSHLARVPWRCRTSATPARLHPFPRGGAHLRAMHLHARLARPRIHADGRFLPSLERRNSLLGILSQHRGPPSSTVSSLFVFARFNPRFV